MIYFDQAASSHPKPYEVTNAVYQTLVSNGANPGRGGHQYARLASRVVEETRESIAHTFGCNEPRKCIFHPNATSALNMAIKGMGLTKGDHVITSSYEHNSIRRPLEHMKIEKGIDVSYIEGSSRENFLLHFQNAIQYNTKLVAMTHASNVTGAMLPLHDICRLAKEHHIKVLVDASQSVGHVQIDMTNMGIDMLAFPGHKGLLGPQGTGVLLVEGDLVLEPAQHGGTGIRSENIYQPAEWPERMESGTLNTPGIAGLHAAITEWHKRETENVSRETFLINTLIKGLRAIPGIVFYGPDEGENRLPIAAFNIRDIDSHEIATILDSHYEIAVRAGLHCNPLTHKWLNTVDQGIIRVSLGKYNTVQEVEEFLKAIKEISDAFLG